MLDTPGDLIPVIPAAAQIPWTRRRSQILNFLHRGPVKFTTLVYDTNVGDISPLASYFNPQRISEKDLNSKFGQYPTNEGVHAADVKKLGSEAVLMPRLLLYPTQQEVMVNPVKGTEQDVLKDQGNQRTLHWLLSQEDLLNIPQAAAPLSPLLPCGPTRGEVLPPEELERGEANCLLDLDCINLGQQLSDSWKEPLECAPLSQTMPALGLGSLLEDDHKSSGKTGHKWDTMLFNQTTWL